MKSKEVIYLNIVKLLDDSKAECKLFEHRAVLKPLGNAAVA
jgi:hypothetical protein